MDINKRKKLNQQIAFNIFRLMSILVIAILGVILGFIIYKGFSVLSWKFLTSMPEEGMTKGGILPAIVGTGYLIFGSMVFAFPIGVLSGIYINEYAKAGMLKNFIRMMTNNLAGIPSIVFGLFGI